MSDKGWNHNPAVNRFAAWFFLGLGIFGVALAVSRSRWWDVLGAAGIIALAVGGLRATRPNR